MVISDYQSSFPLPYLLVVLGYAFILLIDRVIIDAHTAAVESQQTDDKDEIGDVQTSGRQNDKDGTQTGRQVSKRSKNKLL